MQRLVISLPDELFTELKSAAADTLEMCYGPSQFAADCVASVLASRRLPRVRIPVSPLDAFERKPLVGLEDFEV